MKVKFHAFLTSTLDEDENSASGEGAVELKSLRVADMQNSTHQ
jgi:hypothetical protein